MTEMPKVLVFDNGRRTPDSALSSELAEMGFASVTTPFEAADDVLAMFPSPVAIVLQMSWYSDAAERSRFQALAARLRSGTIPVILTGSTANAAALLQDRLGSRS